MSKPGAKGRVSTTVSRPNATKEYAEDEESESDMSAGQLRAEAQRFTARKKPVTLEVIKGTLLATADQILNTLNDILLDVAKNDKGPEKMSAAETELVVLCKLELAAIARQKQHAALAARLVLGALKVLQDTDVLKEKKTKGFSTRRMSSIRGDRTNVRESSIKLVDPETSQYQYQNFQSRARLDARLWLNCRKALVQSLLGEVRGMGELKGFDRTVKVELADVRQYVAEGIAESEVCGDVEMQAEFLMFASVLDHMEGKHVDVIMETLQEVLELLDKVAQPSTPGSLLKALAEMHSTDLQAAASQGQESASMDVLQQYCNVKKCLLTQLELHGEKIEHHYPAEQCPEWSAPCSPIQNLYLVHLLPLVQVKLRIGHTMARNAARKASTVEDPAVLWAKPLGVLTTALGLCQVIVTRIASVEAEILLSIGKLQKQLVQLSRCEASVAIQTLLQAIYTSYANDHNMGLIRQAYLEIALVYMANAGAMLDKEGSTIGSTQDLLDESLGLSTGKPKKKKWKSKKDKSRKTSTSSDVADKDKKAASVAIRCAAAVCESQKNKMLLVGNNAAMEQPITNKGQALLPEFLALDLVSSYVVGEKKRIYKNEIEEELAPLIEELEPIQIDTYDEQVRKAKEAAQKLSWVHILGYQSVLQRMSSTATLTIKQETEEEKEKAQTSELDAQFDLGFISHMDASSAVNYDVVQTVLFSSDWMLRLNHLHQYLCAAQPLYTKECTAVYPPKVLSDPSSSQDLEPIAITCKSYNENLSLPADPVPDVTEGLGLPPSAPGSQTDLYKPGDKAIVSPSDSELCIQWYQPSLDALDDDTDTEQETRILLLWASTRKADKSGSASSQSGLQWLSLKQLADLHDRLSVLRQRGEISLEDKKPSKKEREIPPSRGVSRKQVRIKALSAKQKKDEQLEVLLLQCLTEAEHLFRYTKPEPVEEPQTEDVIAAEPSDQTQQQPIPFDVNRSNMQHFEYLLDPSGGHILKENKMIAWFSKFLTKTTDSTSSQQAS